MTIQTSQTTPLHEGLIASLGTEPLPRIITIAAPPGYGKTQFAKQLTSSLTYPITWLTLTEWQRDVYSLHKASCDVWQQFLPIQLDDEVNHETHPEDIATTFAYTINHYITKSHVFVLDDIHLLTGNSALERYLDTLVTQLSQHITMVFVGRSLPTLNWISHQANYAIAMLNTKHLQVTSQEVQTLLKCDLAYAQTLVETFSGWIAGILLEHRAQQTIALPYQDVIGQETTAFNTLMQAYWQDIWVNEQEFLLATATVKTFTLPVCHTLGIQSPWQALQAVLQQGLFIEETAEGFRYHDLFRDFLQQELKQTNISKYQALHSTAARLYEADHASDDAIFHHTQADNLDAAVALSEKIAKDYFIHGKWHQLTTIANWLYDADAPYLQLYAAVINLNLQNLDAALHHGNRSMTLFDQQEDSIGKARATLQYTQALLRMGRYSDASKELANIRTNPNMPEDIIGWANRIQGLVALEIGDYKEAIYALTQAHIFTEKHKLQDDTLAILQDLSSAYMRLGNNDKASTLLQKVVGIRRQSDDYERLALALNNLGYFYHCQHLYQDALRTYTEALNILAGSTSRAVAYLNWSIADVKRDLGQFQDAEFHYRTAIQLAQNKEQTLYERVVLNVARLYIWQNRLQDAQRILHTVIRSNSVSQSKHRQIINVLHNLLTILQSQQSDDFLAGNIYNKTTHLLDTRDFLGLAHIIGIYQLVAYRNNNADMITHAHWLFEQLPSDVNQPLVADLVHIQELHTYLSDNPNYSSLNNHIRHLASQQPIQRQHAPLGNYHRLTLKTLGQDTVIRDGQAINNSDWVITFARELFYFIYFNGPQTKQQLVNEFWADASPNQIRNALHDTLKRLRKALPKGIIFNYGTYQIADIYYVQADTDTFYDAISRAMDLPPSNLQAIDLYDYALSLYQGDFLPGYLSDWVMVERQKLHQEYINALLGRADCAQSHQDFTKAIACYNSAIDKEPYDESIYRTMMTCYAKTKGFSNVQAVYNLLAKRLREDLDTDVSYLTTNIFKKLMSQK